MILIDKNIWDDYDILDFVGITTNSILNSKGHLVMGAGIAKEAKERYPFLPKAYGEQVKNLGVEGGFYGILLFNGIFAFQTKIHWRESSPLEVVEKSIGLLNKIARARPNKSFGLPFPAINNGGRSESEVLPLLEVLPDNVKVYRLQKQHKVK